MQNYNFDKKRVAKNTMFLYFRMILIMLVQFYTVRVTLKSLGVTDYGIYNLVGGVTNMFVFLTHTMTSASQRFFAFDIGQSNVERLKRTVDTFFIVFFALGFFSVIVLELVGNGLIIYKLVIPENRQYAALVIFQISLITLFITILALPLNSLIIAHEDMRTFAHISILEAILKLAIVYLLVFIDTDKLILYAFLYLCVQIATLFLYAFHCFRYYPECDNRLSYDASITRKIVPFMSWNLLGGFSWMLCTQGLTILVNIFFGPIANAAKAIADKLDGSVNAFMNNFMMAAQPQIVKTYANGEMEAMHSLIFLSSRISFYLIMCISIPIIFNTHSLLVFWLGEVDELTVNMVQVILAFSMISSLENPINQSIRATGNIRNYQIYIALITFCVIPLAYFFFSIGLPAYYGYIALFIVYGMALLLRLYFLKKQIGISYLTYINNVVLRQFVCLILTLGLSYLILIFSQVCLDKHSIIRTIMMFVVAVLVVTFVGLKDTERKQILSMAKRKLSLY